MYLDHDLCMKFGLYPPTNTIYLCSVGHQTIDTYIRTYTPGMWYNILRKKPCEVHGEQQQPVMPPAVVLLLL